MIPVNAFGHHTQQTFPLYDYRRILKAGARNTRNSLPSPFKKIARRTLLQIKYKNKKDKNNTIPCKLKLQEYR